MATRALIGYIENGVLTSTYNHYDGYPENLGKALENFFDSPTLAKDIANYGYISYINPETGEIEAANTGKPDTLNLNKLDPQDASEEVAGLVDSYGADYAYFYNPDTSNWDHIKNNGIRSMVDALEGILFQGSEEMDEAYHVGGNKEVITKEAKVNLLTHIMMSLEKLKKSLDPIEMSNYTAYEESVMRDILSGDDRRFNQYLETDFDWEEDYKNYIMDRTDIDESFVHQMKYKAGIIK
jgi:hypothetical protein